MFHQTLSHLVTLSGKTQKDIAIDLQISRQRFNFYVTGKREPDLGTLVVLANYFNVTTDHLLGQPTPPTHIKQGLSPAATTVLSLLEVLNPAGEEALISYAQFLLTNPAYKKHTQPSLAQKRA